MIDEKVKLVTKDGKPVGLYTTKNNEGSDSFVSIFPAAATQAATSASPKTFSELMRLVNTSADATDTHVEETIKKFTNSKYTELIELAYKADGSGSFVNPISTFLSGHDRFHHNIVPPLTEHTGYTFITRPRLCLKDANIRRDSCFAPLLTRNAASLGFMMRALLDTKFSRETPEVGTSQLMNVFNPFFVPLCNAMTSISGWPDPYLDTYTTSTGFHGEDQTFALGSNRLQATYDLSLSFKDMTFSPITYLMFYWRLYIEHVCKGTMLAYPDDIDNQTLNYTVSIYRFIFDSSYKFITKYAKATGCFPKALPLGDMFNVNDGEIYTTAGAKFTIPFIANKVEYNDPRIFLDFNRLVERYCPDIANGDIYTALSNSPITNFHPKAVPYITASKDGVSLAFKCPITDNTDTSNLGG